MWRYFLIGIAVIGGAFYLGHAIMVAPLLAPVTMADTTPTVPVRSETTALVAPTRCTGNFLARDLDHTTTTADGTIRAFAANGAGLAVNDLDNDGNLDLVFGAEHGPNTILWNDGALNFTQSTFGQGPTRAVTVIDIDADGARDVILTSNRGVLGYWHNEGGRTFRRRVLPGIANPAYALNWGDLDNDGDLDLVTASYDAGFLADIGNEYLLGNNGGVYVYANQAGTFRPTRLSNGAQALALALWDLNGDGQLDILVGNDFAVPDDLWLRQGEGWQASEPFATTAYSTMSLDQGDIDNNGSAELFAADMNPYDIAPATLAQWLPVINRMSQGSRLRSNVQKMANVLQVNEGGSWREEATARGIQATGWSWTSRFGDLDNDGFLDLYVVNGMIEAGTFGHLPDDELVEANQVYRNDGRGYFTSMTQWDLASTRSGRSMIMADLDRDGDLDIVVNNLRSAAQLFENRLCGGRSVQIALQWPSVQNRDGVGATLTLYTSIGTLTRDVRAASGYLSGDAPLVHFGLPVDATVERLAVHWPDGGVSRIPLTASGLLVTVTRE